MNYKKPDQYMTLTPKSEVEICEKCPYPQPKCGANGCKHFKQIKSNILKARGDKRRLRGKNAEAII